MDTDAPSTAFIPPPAGSIPGTLHFIPPNLSAFEPAVHHAQSLSDVNTLLWVGGLMDTLLSVSYPVQIAKALPSNWRIVLASLSSSGLQFGIRSVSHDVEDLAAIVAYIKKQRPLGKIVLMGHSTGCQDCALYYKTKTSPELTVESVILQAPVSDREAFSLFLSKEQLASINAKAQEFVDDGRADDVLPSSFTNAILYEAPISARRWLDLASPDHEGADDMFSSDLSDDRFADVFAGPGDGASWMLLYSGNDEAVPKTVDKQTLVHRWTKVIESRLHGKVDKVNGGIVPGASHNLNGSDDKIVQDLVKRVVAHVTQCA